MDISEYLVETNEHYGGVQRVYKFSNGYGASVIRHKGSYGYSKGLWELAVLDEFGELDYTTPITNDVLGHLSEEEIILKINEIRGLQTS